ncbi:MULTISPECIES: hypothetical protein [unclassified Microcoleus]|uniref:hypothetical protein n=1 Tax=unclassified Microcoleus TaxID=2642155 RepID=UPI002FCE864A
MPGPQKPVTQELKLSLVSRGWASWPPLKSLLQILQLFSFNKLWPISAIGLFSLTLSISLFLSLHTPPTTAAQKPKMLAFVALQRRGSEVRNSLFAVNANGSARRELTRNIDVIAPLERRYSIRS